MAWAVNITPEARDELKKLGLCEAQRILNFLNERLQNREKPRELGKALKGNRLPFRDAHIQPRPTPP